MDFQESEIVCLVVVVAFAISMVSLRREMRPPRLMLIYLAIGCLVVGHVATVAESVLWGDFFNLLEHVSYAASGVLLAIGVCRIACQSRRERGGRS